MNQLRTLVMIAQSGSFSITAERLYKTQSAITHQMHRLEDVIGFAIFEKQGRNKALTPNGLRLVQYANQVLAINDEIFRAFKDDDVKGTIRIGSPHDAGESILPSILKLIHDALPHVKIETSIDLDPKLMERLQAGDIDMTISPRFKHQLEGVVLRTSPTVWLCAADYIHDASAPVPLIVANGVSLYREMALAAMAQSHMRWEINHVVSNVVDIKAAIRAGLGVTPRSIGVLSPDLRILGEQDGLPPLPDITHHLWIGPNMVNASARRAYETLKQAWGLVDVRQMAHPP